MNAPHALLDIERVRAETAAAGLDVVDCEPLALADVTRLVPERVVVPAPTGAYRLRLAAVAVATVALPLIYLGLVAALAGGIWWHASSNFALVLAKEMRGKTYAAPILIGLVLLFFLLKPLLAPRSERPDPCTVTREDQPVLHAFVGAIARAVGAPEPVRIDIDVSVNASASLRRGWRSFGGGDLVLTIGTPLLEGMTVDEVGGVLAHELGHFRQGWGMRASFAIWTVNAWLDRAVNGRDKWDERLKKSAGYAWVLTVARGGIWLTRRILWVLMTIGMRLDAALSRHMEIDADEHELALVGSETLTAVMRKLVLLDAAHSRALSAMRLAWRDGQVPASAPALIRQCRARLGEDECVDAVQSALDAETRTLSTHPCVKERIEHAARRAAPATFACDLPARALLRDPDALYRRATVWHYTEVIGVSVTEDQLASPTDLLAGQDAAEAANEAGNRVTRGTVAYFLPFDPEGGDAAVAGAPSASGAPALDVLEAHGESARRALDRIDQADTRLAHVARCRAVRQAGGDPDDIEKLVVTDRSDDALARAVAEARAAIAGLRRPVDACHAALRDRFAAARARLDPTNLEGAQPPHDDAQRFDVLAAALSAIAARLDDLDALRHDGYADTDLRRLIAADEGKNPQDIRRAFGTRAIERLRVLREAWTGIAHPFGVRGEAVDLAVLVGSDRGGDGTPDPIAALAVADASVDAAWQCYFRALNELCVLVERIEAPVSDPSGA